MTKPEKDDTLWGNNMTTERESLSGLEAQKQSAEAGITKARSFIANFGVTDIVPHLQLDPQNITQFSERRPIVREVNRRLIQNAIPTLQTRAEELQVKIDDSLIAITQKVDEDLAIASRELEETQKDVDVGFLPPTILAGLNSVIENLRAKQTQPDYIRAKGLLEARKQVTPQAPVEPTPAPAESEQPGVIEEAPAQIVIGDKNFVEINGHLRQLTDEEIALLRTLSERAGEKITSRALSKEALGIDDPVKGRLRFKMATLAEILEYESGRKLIVSRMAGAASGYKLQDVAVSFKEAEGEVTPAESEISAAKEQTGYAFNEDTGFYEIPLVDGQVLTTRGEKKAKILGELVLRHPDIGEIAQITEGDRKLAAAWIAQLRKDKGLEKVKWEVFYQEPEEKTRTAKGSYYLRQIPGQPEEGVVEVIPPSETIELEQPGFTTQEIAVLHSEFQERTQRPIQIDGDYIQFEIPLHVRRAFRKLLENYPAENLDNLTAEEKSELKKKVFGEITELIKNGDLNKSIADFNPDQQVIIRWIYILDHEGQRGMAIRFLSENPHRFTSSVRQWIKDIVTSEEQAPDIQTQAQPETESPEEIYAISENQLLALSAYTDDIHLEMQQILELLRSDHEGITEADAKDLIIQTAEKLKNRFEQNLVTEHEAELWEKIKNLCKEEAGILAEFCKGVRETDSGVTEETLEERSFDMRPKTYAIEKRDPQARARIRTCVEEVFSEGFDEWTIFRVENAFRRDLVNETIGATHNIVNLAREQGIIRKPKGDPHKVAKLDVAILLYYLRCKREGIQINGLIAEARKIALDEIDNYLQISRRKR